MKTSALLLTVVLLATGCTTRYSSKIGMGVGLGVAASGGVVIASQGDGNLGAVVAAGGLAAVGGSIFLLSLIGYGIAVANEPPRRGTTTTIPAGAAVRAPMNFELHGSR